MVVVAILAVVAALAVPNLIRSKMTANEATAIASCKAYAEAQDIYRRTDYNQNGILEYACSLASLYTSSDAGDLALIDEAFALAEGDLSSALPKSGYCFRILDSQGSAAPGGTCSYWRTRTNRQNVDVRAMVLGYGLSAVPGQYDISGRNTFQINHSGSVYQIDRGAVSTLHLTEYDPASGWIITE
jgi:type II secretory pathway pseudopilin PulG